MHRLHNPFSFALILSFALLAPACDQDEPVETADAETDTLREACVSVGEARDCDAGEGTQFCSGIAGTVAWGECLADVACMPGDSDCVLVDGVPQLQPGEPVTTMPEDIASTPAETENAMSKICYGGTGWLCCDTKGCWSGSECWPELCCEISTECWASEG